MNLNPNPNLNLNPNPNPKPNPNPDPNPNQGMLFFGAQSQALAYYSVFLETGFALLIYGDLFVMGMHGILMDVSNVDP